jgi:putative hydrolase of the HAD superfamily
MGMRKPDPDIYTTVINNHELIPKHTYLLMIKENTDAALQLGLQVWNLQVVRGCN